VLARNSSTRSLQSSKWQQMKEISEPKRDSGESYTLANSKLLRAQGADTGGIRNRRIAARPTAEVYAGLRAALSDSPMQMMS
jgi:hypothetical protein